MMIMKRIHKWVYLSVEIFTLGRKANSFIKETHAQKKLISTPEKYTMYDPASLIETMRLCQQVKYYLWANGVEKRTDNERTQVYIL